MNKMRAKRLESGVTVVAHFGRVFFVVFFIKKVYSNFTAECNILRNPGDLRSYYEVYHNQINEHYVCWV